MQAIQTPVAAAAASTVAPATNVPAMAPNRRVRKVHSLASLFTECPGLRMDPPHRDQLQGFLEPGKCVPARIEGFLQEEDFVRKFASAYRNPRGYVIVLFGPTGAGKTDRVVDFFARLNVPLLHDAVNAETKAYELIGSMQLVEAEGGTVTKFVDGILIKAMKAGCPILLDEAYKLDPAITSRFHTIRDKGALHIHETGETVVARPGFKLICTSNQAGYGDTTGMHHGDRPQDAAWLNGANRIRCDYLPASVETMLVQNYLESLDEAFGRVDFLKTWAAGLVSVAQKIRAASSCNLDLAMDFSAQRLECVCSTRDLLNICWFAVDLKGAPGNAPLIQAFDIVMLDSCSQATRVTVDAWLSSDLGLQRI